jgi:AraC-like DNA-binding protein
MSSLTSPVVAPQFVIDLLQGALRKNIDTDELIGDIVSYRDLQNEQSPKYISLVQYAEILRRLMSALDDEFIGLLESRIPRRTFATWCYGINGCKNGFEVVSYSNLFVSLFSEQISWSFDELDNNRVKLTLHFNETENTCSRFMVMSLLAIPLRVLGWFINEKIRIDKVAVSFEELPSDKLNLQYLLGAELRFCADENYVIVEKRYLNENIVSNHQQIGLFLKDTRAQLLLRQIFAPFCHQVRNTIKDNFDKHGIWLSFPDLCRVLKLDEATVKQKLKKEDSSYRALINDEKERVAKYLLKSTDLSLTDIAIQLGYSELSGFHKAFTNWIGISPGDYRR